VELQNFEQAVRDFRKATPFRNFFIELVTGRVIKVEHPEALLTRAGQAVYLSPEGAASIFDHTSVARVYHTSEEPMQVVR
jgi:hypothetical protein